MRVLLALTVAALLGVSLCQQLSSVVSNEVFLHGNFIEVGIHSVASYGTSGATPAGFNGAANSPRTWGGGVGFIADYGKDGFAVGNPKFSGDYFLPGSPLEGWSVEYTVSGSKSVFLCKGRVGNLGITPSSVSDTSRTGTLSAVWVGQGGNLKVSKTTSFRVNDLYFLTTVTLKNMGTTQMTTVDYMRNVDPDQEQPWSGSFTTKNWVQYQVARTGETPRINAATPNMCLVVATGVTYSALALGLGTVHPFCRVSHYGFKNDDSTTAWTNTAWLSFSSASPRSADEGINMVLRFPTLDPGASISFSWAYILNQADLLPALNSIASVTIVQPTDTASGRSCTFSANIGAATTLVQFFVQTGAITSLVGSATVATVPDTSTGGGLYQVSFDTTTFVSADGYSFLVSATIGGSVVSSSKVIRIDNTGPLVSISISPAMTAPFLIDNVNTFTISAAYVSGPAVASVQFFLDQATTSNSLGTDATSPYTASVSTTLALYTLITIRAVATSSDGRQQVATLSGIVAQPNLAPTNIALAGVTTTACGPTIPENAPAGQIIGTFSTTDPNAGDSFTYAVLTSTTLFSVLGGSLVVASGATFNYNTASSISVNVRSTDQGGLSFTKTFTVCLSYVQKAPTAIVLSRTSLPENSAVNFLLGTFSVTDPDSTTFTMLLVNSGSGSFYVSGMGLYVAKSLSFNLAPTVTIGVQATDSTGLSLTVNIPITVTWVNKAPTFINITSTRVAESQAINTVVGTLSTTDPDNPAAAQTFAYLLTSSGSGKFGISGSNLVTKAVLSYYTSPAVDVTIMSTDSAGLSYSQTYTITVLQVPTPPAVSDTVMAVAENTLAGTVVGAITLQPGADVIPLNFTINTTRSDAGWSMFRVQLCSGTVFVNQTGLDYEARQQYKFYVDVVGLLKTQVLVTVNIIDVNESPDPQNTAATIPEHSAVGLVVVSSVPSRDPDFGAIATYSFISGNIGGMFALDSASGRISLALSTLNYQNLPVGQKYYSLVVSVSDGQLVGYCTATVTVTNVPEPPHVTACVGMAVAENSPANTLLPYPVVAYDEDGNAITFSIDSGNTNNAFRFSSSYSAGGPADRANLTVNAAVLNYETTPGFAYSLVVRATDSVSQFATFPCSVSIIDVNEAPSAPATATFSVPENSAPGTQIGSTTLSATDPDLIDRLTWSVVSWGSMASSFISLDSTGRLSLLLSPNFELQSVYTFNARVTDKGGLTADTAVTVNIANLNEPPTLPAADSRTVAENSASGSDVFTTGQRLDICPVDDDVGQVSSFALSPTTAGFAVSSAVSASGVTCARITSTRSFNFEAMTGPVVLNLTACDNGTPSLCSTGVFSIFVTDVNEAPTLNSSLISILEESRANTAVGAPLVVFDPDAGDYVTFSIVAGNTSLFSLTQLSDRLAQLRVAPSYGARLRDAGPRWFLLSITATDLGGLSTTASVNVSLIYQNDPPVVYAANFTVEESVPVLPAGSAVGTVVGTVASYNRQNFAMVFSIVSGDPQGQFAINPTTAVITVRKATIDINTVSRYVLTVQAMDLPPNATDTQYGSAQIGITVLPVNHPPTLPTPPVANVNENSPVGTLCGPPVLGVDTDAGDRLTYTLLTYFNVFSINATSGQLSVRTASLNFEALSSYSITVQVSDIGGLSATNTLVLNLNDVNEAPTLSAASRSIAENSAVGLSLGAPLNWTDPDAGDRFTFAITAGNTASAFSIDSTGTLYVAQYVLDFETQPVYTLTVRVTDSGGLTSSAAVTVQLLDVNEAPVFVVSSLAVKSVPENSPVGTWITPRILATDVDARQSLTYAIPPGQDVFGIDPVNGTLVLLRAVLDFETRPSYTLTVTVSDNGSLPLTVSALVTVSLIDVNEKPTASFKGVTLYVNEGCCSAQVYDTPTGSAISTLAVADVDAADQGKLLVRFTDANYSTFSLTASTGLLAVSAPLDFETRALYTFNATVTDTGGLSDTGLVTVIVNDVNEVPVILPQARSVNENSPRNTPVGLPLVASDVDMGQFLAFSFIAGNDLSLFSINPCSGQITVAKPSLNYELTSTYVLTVLVQDDGYPKLSASANVTISILDVNEAPVLTPQSFFVNENSAVGTLVGVPQTVWDEDFVDTKWFNISGGVGANLFAINSATGQLRVAVNSLDFEFVRLYTLTLTVFDKGNLSDSQSFLININNVNEAPVIIMPQSRTIPENSAVGTVASGPMITYWDPENDTVTWTLTGGFNASSFTLGSATGLFTLQAAVLDFEVYPRYSLSVRATDPGALFGTGTVFVDVTDVLEAPVVPSVTFRVPENSYFAALGSGPFNTLLGSLVVYEQDTVRSMSYSITAGDPLEVFRVRDVNNGQGAVNVTLAGFVDFETQASYTLQLTARHSVLSSVGTITVLIDNVNEAPFFGGSQAVPFAVFAMQVPELSSGGTLLSRVDAPSLNAVTAQDVDAGDVLTYTLVSGDASRFAIAPVTGVVSVVAGADLQFQVLRNFVLVVRATDAGGLSATANITVTLLEVNKPPFFTSALTGWGVGRNSPPGTVVKTVVGKDFENAITYELASQQSPGLFGIDATNGTITVTGLRTLLETNLTFWMVVRLREVGTVDGFTTTANVSLLVTNQNFPPVLSPPASYAVSENSALGTLIGVLPFNDPDNATQFFTFTVSRPEVSLVFDVSTLTARLFVNGTLDFEAAPELSVTVTVSDNFAYGTMFDSKTFVLTVLDVNEPPSFELSQFAALDGSPLIRLRENATGTVVPGLVVGDIVVADVDSASKSFGQETFSLVAGVVGQPLPFRIESVSGDARRGRIFLTTAGPFTPDFETRPSYSVIVTCVDGGGLATSATFTIGVIDMNDPPFASPFTFSVAENSAAGTLIGTVYGNDTDRPVFLAYSILGGNDDGLFSLDTNGRLTVAGPLDFEARRSYVLSVQAQDQGQGDDTSQLTTVFDTTVLVTNVNDVLISGFSGVTRHATAGGETVLISGANFGPLAASGYAAATVRASYGPTGVEYVASNCAVISGGNTQLSCSTVPGSGAGLRWRVNITADGITNDMALSPASLTTAYLPPSVLALSLSAQALRSNGSDAFVVYGINFGPLVADVSVAYGSAGRTYTPLAGSCTLTTVAPAQALAVAEPTLSLLRAVPALQALSCLSAPGVGTRLAWQVTVSKQSSDWVLPGVTGGVGANVSASSYVPPAVSGVTPSVAAFTTRGGDSVLLSGTNFGMSGLDAFNALSVYYGPGSDPLRYTARSCRVLASAPHTGIQCFTTTGVGASHVWSVAVGEQRSAPSVATTRFVGPAVSKISGPGTFQAKTDGGQRVTIKGAEFGTPADTVGKVVVTYGHDGRRFTAEECVVGAAFDTIDCVTAPGTGKDLSWYVAIDGQESALFMANTSYGQPVVAFYNGTGMVDGTQECLAGDIDCGVTQGAQTVDVNGLNFGPASLGNALTVTYGHNGTELLATDCVIVQDHVRIRCATVPGAGAKLVWRVIVDGQVSVSPTTSYGAPRINSISGPGAVNASTYGGEQVVIDGANFGPVGASYLQAVTYGPYTAADCVVISHFQIVCNTVAGIGRDLKWTVLVEGQQSVEVVTSSYADPAILAWNYGSFTPFTEGGYTLVIQGSNFGLAAERVATYVVLGGYSAAPIELTPATTTRGGSIGLDPSGRVVQGMDVLSVVVPPGRGKGFSVAVGVDRALRSAGTARVSPSRQFDYASPRATMINTRVISGTSGLNCSVINPFTGVQLGPNEPVFDITLRGFNFGPPNALGNGPAIAADSDVFPWVQLDSSTVPAQSILASASPLQRLTCFETWDHTMVRFSAPLQGSVGMNFSSIGSDGTLYLDATAPLFFSFDAPSISNLKSVNNRDLVLTNGSSVVRIEGRNLYTEGVPTNVTIGGDTAGQPLAPWRVNFGPIPGTDQSTGVASSIANQFVEVIVPPWQGTAIPLLVFKVFPASAPGSQPYYVDVMPPAARGGRGTSGAISDPAPRPTDPMLTARTDGSSRLALFGDNFGAKGTYLRFLNTFADANGTASTVNRTFTDCTRNDSYVECTVPQGVGAVDSLGVSLQVIVVQPRLICNPAEQSVAPSDPTVREWSRCTVIEDPTPGRVQTSAPWRFRYEAPVLWAAAGVLPTSGGRLSLTGMNFGSAVFALPVVTLVSSSGAGSKSCVNVSAPSAGTPQSFSCDVGEGVGTGWALSVSVGGQSQALNNVTVAYAPPTLTDISLSSGNTSGGYNVTLTGTNLGGAGFGSVLVADVATAGSLYPSVLVLDASSVLAASHTSVTFVMPPEQGRKRISVLVGGQASNSVAFAYSPPVLTLMAPTVIPTSGSSADSNTVGVVTLTGYSFGMRGAVVEIAYPAYNITLKPYADYLRVNNATQAPVAYLRRLTSHNCTLTDGTSSLCSVSAQGHTSVTVRMPPGMGVNATLRLYVVTGNESVASAPIMFNYAPPSVSAIVPNVLNAVGDDVVIYGDNFGALGSENMPPIVHVGGRPCVNAQLVTSPDQTDPRPFIQCKSQNDVVGPRNLTVSIAFQTVFVPAGYSRLQATCKPGFFGAKGEFCDPCPPGAICEGGNIARSLAGWYNVTYNDRAGCTPQHMTSPVCWQPLPCQPPEACLGNNTCAAAYRDPVPMLRCSACSLGHYRMGGDCIKCPNNAWMLIVGFICALIAVASIGYFLNRKSVNLSFMSIGIDYFQVIAMFSRTKIQWPASLKNIFTFLSIFNFNIDITAPECAMPSLGYKTKWMFVEGVPAAVLISFVLLHFLQYTRKRVLGRKKKLHSHLPALVGTAFVMMYYLYLNLTRSILDVFNCEKLVPDMDGKKYLRVEFEECSKPGGIHETLKGPASVLMALYCFGYPLSVLFILYKNRMRIMEDQLLRAEGLGKNRLENPNCYDLRKMYHKMYFHFKPDCYYWILLILSRKLVIAMTSLMFNRNPAFQMAMCLLTLFIAYAAQVRFSPYMSMSERSEVLFQSKRKAELGSRVHITLQAVLKDVKRLGKKSGARVDMDKKISASRADAIGFFWNYNTVESVLLFSAVLVNLAGVMFESGQLEKPGYGAQKDLLTYVILLVIILSIVYFAVVTVSEIYMMLKAASHKEKALKGKVPKDKPSLDKAGSGKASVFSVLRPKKDTSRRRSTFFVEPDLGAGGTESVNPFFNRALRDGKATPAAQVEANPDTLFGSAEPPNEAQWAVIRESYRTAVATNEELSASLAAAKAQLQRAAMGGPTAAIRREIVSARKPATRKEFGAVNLAGDIASAPSDAPVTFVNPSLRGLAAARTGASSRRLPTSAASPSSPV